MNFTPEQIVKAKAAKSAEELIALAKENGLELTEEEAKNYFEQWHKEGELSDDELDNVSGGCGNDEPEGPYTEMYCSHCGWTTKWNGYFTDTMQYYGPCPECGAQNIFAGTYHG